MLVTEMCPPVMCLLSRKQAPAEMCGMTALQISMETSEELEGTEATVQRMETAQEEGRKVQWCWAIPSC